MSIAVSESRRSLLESSLISGFVSLGAFVVAAASLRSDAMRYVLLALAIASFASPIFKIPKRLVNYTSKRRGTSYITIGAFLLPIALVLIAAFLGYFIWLGIDAGILSTSDYSFAIFAILASIVFNLGILIYNIVRIRNT